MVDPQIMLHAHIALLEMLQTARDDVEKATGLHKAMIKGIGRHLQFELRKSKDELRQLKMWVQDSPVGEMQYVCGMNGKRDVYTISSSDLHVAITYQLQKMELLLN